VYQANGVCAVKKVTRRKSGGGAITAKGNRRAGPSSKNGARGCMEQIGLRIRRGGI